MLADEISMIYAHGITSRTLLTLVLAFAACSNEESSAVDAGLNVRRETVTLDPFAGQRRLQGYLLKRDYDIQWNTPVKTGARSSIMTGQLAKEPDSLLISSVVGKQIFAVVSNACASSEC